MHALLWHLLLTWAQGAVLASGEEAESVALVEALGRVVLLTQALFHVQPPSFRPGWGHLIFCRCKHRGAQFFYKGNVMLREVIDMDSALVCSQWQRTSQNRSVWRRAHLHAFCVVTLLKIRLIVMCKHK